MHLHTIYQMVTCFRASVNLERPWTSPGFIGLRYLGLVRLGPEPCPTRHSWMGGWALRQGHLQLQALALADDGQLNGLTWLGPQDESLEILQLHHWCVV